MSLLSYFFFFDPFTKSFPHILCSSPVGVLADEDSREMAANQGLLVFHLSVQGG